MIREPTATGFLSTLSLRRATDLQGNRHNTISISIHALLAESDCAPRITPTASRNFYPRSPCGERRYCSWRSTSYRHFYPRSPCGERLDTSKDIVKTTNFYPRSPCGERRNARPETRPSCAISIHALLAESDLINTYHRIFGEGISIHALLAESDNCTSIGRPKRLYFYPRSPCGERLTMETRSTKFTRFLSTLSLRRATPRGGGFSLFLGAFLSTLSLRRATPEKSK